MAHMPKPFKVFMSILTSIIAGLAAGGFLSILLPYLKPFAFVITGIVAGAIIYYPMYRTLPPSAKED